MTRSPDGQMTRSDDGINFSATAAEPSTEPTAKAFAPAASFETAPLHPAMSLKTTSLKPASVKSAIKVATVVAASVIWMSPAVPGACADKDPIREPTRTVVAVGRAAIRIVRVIAVSADRRSSHITAKANAHSDSDLSL